MEVEAFVVGSGQWGWRTETAAGWPEVFRRMGAWIPWNVGNYAGDYASTDFWLEDQNELQASGVLYMPLVYPGFSWDNLMNQPPGTTTKPRLEGDFLWQQFRVAKEINAATVYVAMFDEIDEATSIFKVTNDIPVDHYFLTNEGLPSDFYLSLTGLGTNIVNGQVEMPDNMPDFALQSQPPIPEILSPAYGDTINDISISWSSVQHESGINGYELELDNLVIPISTTDYDVTLDAGEHTARVRAINGLNNTGGFSETIVFTLQNLVSVEETTAPIPSAFNLLQNYPNPFNAGTTIEYHLPKSATVSLKVYNVIGQLVETLVNQQKEAGFHKATWNASHVGSGLYFYKITTGEYSEVKKLMLLN